MQTYVPSDGTKFELPLRINIATGERLEPTGLDPYSLPWVSGAGWTLPRKTKLKYSAQLSDLIERQTVLRSRRPEDYEDRLAEFYRREEKLRMDIRRREEEALYGPAPRSPMFKALDGKPGPSDGNPFSHFEE